MTTPVIPLLADEDVQLVDVDTALILDTVLDLQPVDWNDEDQYDRDGAA